MRSLIKYILILLLFNSINAFSKQSSNDRTRFTLIFKYKKKRIPDTITVWTYPKGNYWDNTLNYKSQKKGDNIFIFELPITNTPLLFRINQYLFGNVTELASYYSQAHDDVQAYIFETQGQDSIVFKGKGAEKYNLVEKLKSQDYSYTKNSTVEKNLLSKEELRTYLIKYTSSIEEQIVKKQTLIENFSQGIDNDIKKLIDYQFVNYEVYWMGLFFYQYATVYKDFPDKQYIIRDLFNKYYPNFLEKSTDISTLSPIHYLGILGIFQMKLAINSKNGMGDIDQYYNMIKAYSSEPKVRERLIAQFLMGTRSLVRINKVQPSVSDSIIQDASKYLTSQEGKAIVLRKTKLSAGANFFDTNFYDIKGNLFDTSSLRGKVFIVDLWGSGCKGCVQFHTMFDKEIWPQLKDNKGFEFLSICINSTKQKWFSDLNRGIYSSKDYLNLYIGEGERENHPFIKYYEINAVPFLLIVDRKGKIISKIEDKLDHRWLLGLIQKTINNTYSK